MEKDYGARLLDSMNEFIASLNVTDQAKILSAIKLMTTGDFKTIRTKQLKGPIREPIVKSYRIVYFLKEDCLYFVSAFVKKSAKTPKREIENAEKIFKTF